MIIWKNFLLLGLCSNCNEILFLLHFVYIFVIILVVGDLFMEEFLSLYSYFYKNIVGVCDKSGFEEYDILIRYIKLLVSNNFKLSIQLVRALGTLKLLINLDNGKLEIFNTRMNDNLDLKVLYEILKLEFCNSFSYKYKNSPNQWYVRIFKINLTKEVTIDIKSDCLDDFIWFLEEKRKADLVIDIDKVKVISDEL